VDLGSAPDRAEAVVHGLIRAVDADWCWPPEAPLHPADGARFGTDQWAPPTVVRHPWVRLGRWTLLYRRRRRWALPPRRRGC
jgi:hypothetical protein